MEENKPIQEKFKALRQDIPFLHTILQNGADAAQAKAAPMLAKVYQAIGFVV